MSQITKFKKRDGNIIDFNTGRIRNAVSKAFKSVNKTEAGAVDLDLIVNNVLDKCNYFDSEVLEIEDVQNNIVIVLVEMKYIEEAMAYLEYKKNRSKVRKQKLALLNKKTLDEIDKTFSFSALRVLAQRCLLRNPDNEIIESPKQLFHRVAVAGGITAVLYDEKVFNKGGRFKLNTPYLEKLETRLHVLRQRIDLLNYEDTIKNNTGAISFGKWTVNIYHQERLLDKYIDLYRDGKMKIGYEKLMEMIQEGGDTFPDPQKFIADVYELMIARKLLPNSPFLMNGGAKLGQGSACFTVPIVDSMDSIMKAAWDCAKIFQSGGGVGINYSELRPEGSMVASTSGVASGPPSFMKIVDTVTDVVKQGGKRRGANMGILEVSHPDIEEFITMKTKPGLYENFNVSVGMWADFWQSLYDGTDYTLSHPKSKIQKSIYSKTLIDLIAFSAWKSAEPGVIFFDNINRHNQLMSAMDGMPIKDTNPCAEIPFYPYESCILCSISLPYFVSSTTKDKQFDWDEFSRVCKIASQFMDNIIDYNKYPIPEIKERTNQIRRTGVGTMGIGDLLQVLQIPYNSKKGYQMMADIMESLTYWTELTSCHLGKVRGNFPLFEKSGYRAGLLPVDYERWSKESTLNLDWKGLSQFSKECKRNGGSTSTNAPTGTLSMLTDVSNGIEPVFSNAFEKRITVGRFFYVNKNLEKWLKDNHLYTDDILEKISNNYGSVKGIAEIPADIQEIFCTAIDIHWVDHILASSFFQRWTGNANSKTINLPQSSTIAHIRGSYLLAHEFGMKGCSVYRDGSRNEQVLHVGANTKSLLFDILPSGAALDIIQRHLDSLSPQENNHKSFFINTLKECGFEIVDSQVIYKELNPHINAASASAEANPQVISAHTSLINVPQSQVIAVQVGAPCSKSECEGILTPNGKCLICNVCGTSTSCSI